IIWHWKFLEQTVREHGAGTAAAFFSGLTDEDQGAAPLVFHLRQYPRGTYPAGHDHVMSTGMHRGDLVPRVILASRRTGIRQAGLFFDWKPIHFHAHEHRPAISIPQYSNNSIHANFAGYRETGLSQFIGNPPRCPLLVKRKLWMQVKVFVKRE